MPPANAGFRRKSVSNTSILRRTRLVGNNSTIFKRAQRQTAHPLDSQLSGCSARGVSTGELAARAANSSSRNAKSSFLPMLPGLPVLHHAFREHGG